MADWEQFPIVKKAVEYTISQSSLAPENKTPASSVETSTQVPFVGPLVPYAGESQEDYYKRISQPLYVNITPTQPPPAPSGYETFVGPPAPIAGETKTEYTARATQPIYVETAPKTPIIYEDVVRKFAINWADIGPTLPPALSFIASKSDYPVKTQHERVFEEAVFGHITGEQYSKEVQAIYAKGVLGLTEAELKLFYKKFGEFPIGEKGLKVGWEEYKKAFPSAKIDIKAGEVFVSRDIKPITTTKGKKKGGLFGVFYNVPVIGDIAKAVDVGITGVMRSPVGKAYSDIAGKTAITYLGLFRPETWTEGVKSAWGSGKQPITGQWGFTFEGLKGMAKEIQSYDRAMKQNAKIDPLGTWISLQAPAYENVIIPMATGYAVGAGVGALKSAYPLAGKVAEAGLVSYGTYSTAEELRKDTSNINRIAFQTPFMIAGYAGGYKAGSGVVSSYLISHNKKPITFGEKFVGRIDPRNYFKKMGATEVKPEDIFNIEVLKGEKTFAESPSPSITLEQFRKTYDPFTKEYSVVHATPYKFKNVGEIGMGTSEHKGVFVTAWGEGSPYFLKTGGGGYSLPQSTEFGLLPKLSRPSVINWKVKNVFRGPNWARQSIKKFNIWWERQPAGSYAVISGKHEVGGKEGEALLHWGTKYGMEKTEWNLLSRLKGYRLYTTYQNKVIPIREKIILDLGPDFKPDIFSKIKGIETLTPETVSKYSLPNVSYRSVISPYGLGVGSSIGKISSSLKVPISSYAPPPPSSYKIPVSSYKIPVSSYAPPPPSSYKTSVKSYKPYYVPYTPSYKIMYSDKDLSLKDNWGKQPFKIFKSIKPFKMGYRQREWKVPKMESMLNISKDLKSLKM